MLTLPGRGSHPGRPASTSSWHFKYLADLLSNKYKRDVKYVSHWIADVDLQLIRKFLWVASFVSRVTSGNKEKNPIFLHHVRIN